MADYHDLDDAITLARDMGLDLTGDDINTLEALASGLHPAQEGDLLAAVLGYDRDGSQDQECARLLLLDDARREEDAITHRARLMGECS